MGYGEHLWRTDVGHHLLGYGYGRMIASKVLESVDYIFVGIDKIIPLLVFVFYIPVHVLEHRQGFLRFALP